MKGKRKLLWGLVGGIFLCCLIGNVFGRISPDEAEGPSAEPEGELTAPGEGDGNQDSIAPAQSSVASAPSRTPRPTSTRRPTSTPTETLLPPEATKQAAAATGTAKAEEKAAKLTATADRVSFLREYERVNIQDFVSYPGEFVGEKIIVMAEVEEIEGSGVSQEVALWLYSWAGSGFTTAWFDPPLTMDSGVREGYKYAVYGIPDYCPGGTWYSLDGVCLTDAFIVDTSN